MRQAFQVSVSATPWTNQPSSEKVIVVSDSASDGSKSLVLQGTVSAAPDNETVTLGAEGRIEKESTKTFTALVAAALSSSAAGTVSVYGQGSAASGRVIVTTNPSAGNTWTVGLVGNTRTYTFRSLASFTLLTGVAADVTTIVDNDYFDVTISGTVYRFWFEVDGAGGTAPANPGTLTKVSIDSTDTNAEVAVTLEDSIESVITGFTCSVSDATITCVKDVLGAITFTFADGAGAAATGITNPSSVLGASDTANVVTIGATASDTATNLDKAINDTGTEGTHYGTGTTINEYLSSTVSGTIVTITDKIRCDRFLGWTMTQSGTGLSLSAPIGGVNGATLGTIAVGASGIQDSFTLDNEDLNAVTANFPGTITPTFDAILVGGAPFRVYAARGSGSNVVFKIMGGHSASKCTEEILTGLTAGSSTYEVKPVVATGAYAGFEYIKPICTSNGNSSPIQLAAYVVSG
jgi:hypothetical protein